MGWIFHNSTSETLNQGFKAFENIASPLIAEGLAIRQALDLGFKNLHVASDSQQLITAINSKSSLSEIFGILQDISFLSSCFSSTRSILKNSASPSLPSAPKASLSSSLPSPESQLGVSVPEQSFSANEDLVHGPIQSSSLKGAWAKKLNLSKATPSYQASRFTKINSEKWPSLSDSKAIRNQQPREVTSQKSMAMEDDIRFPLAAKMNPASRNLYRATEPEYLEDGTPKVTIPRHVLLQGLENQKEYVLGQFYRCAPPPGGLIYAVFNQLWGRNCKITIRKLGESNYLFYIPDESTRNWVLQRGLWHVDDCLMFVAAWTPEASLAIPEIKTIPVWVTLKKIPSRVYSIPGISHIASGLGAPMATHKPRLDPNFTGEAKILVEVELSKAFLPKIAANDENGFISMVDVEYAWLPSKCTRCDELGHKVKRCLKAVSKVVDNKATETHSKVTTVVTAATIPKSVQINSTPNAGVEVTTSNSLVNISNESNFVDPTSDDLISMATISILESMSASIAHPPTIITINDTVETPTAETPIITISDTIETPMVESAQILQDIATTIAQDHSTSQKESSTLVEPDLGSNKFASLASPEEEEVSMYSDDDLDALDLTTPYGKRILRDRPVKPSTKAKEMHWQIMGRGRGNGGRGNRGGRG
ncbi:unnamed protein product [Microthlaspi erraticum]|uniref:DUF4283 domain-containing protein n=1 Tax=Microthlaspi erraticum TaxID=1685480 RepID=A0A6D2JWQ9_9BRAS|nr:unnamed protein product [Microthlaspi erraticum]